MGWSFNAMRFGPFDNPMGWVRSFGVVIASAIFMTVVGAFDSGRAPLGLRLGYWLILMIVGWVWGVLISRWLFRKVGGPLSVWTRVLASSLILSIPFSVVVRFTTERVLGSRIPLSGIPQLVLSVTAVSFVVIAINVLVDRHAEATTSASAEPPKFLERLPLKLRGAEVWAVEAEDHYLRLHTSRGQDLILMRLADAIAELEGIEGAQVHRSWWIAREAITDARRGDGRATLTLKDGAQVPVSRTYAGMLRERGWI
jgi:hypothetical protein